MNIFFILGLLMTLFIVRIVLRSPKHHGMVGEKRVAKILYSLPKDYHTINNVIIPNRQTTSQIDHVVVSPHGIFVIETKNYSGWIFGEENSKEWKQTFKTKGNFFRNPIKQNWGHIYALTEYLDLNRRVFKPIIVFSDNAYLNIETRTPVIYMSQLKEQILSYTQEIISREKVESIFEQISRANLIGKDSEERHIQSIQENISRQRIALQQGRCPNCGGELILRNGKYGQFYGCSNYPQCRFTHKV